MVERQTPPPPPPPIGRWDGGALALALALCCAALCCPARRAATRMAAGAAARAALRAARGAPASDDEGAEGGDVRQRMGAQLGAFQTVDAEAYVGEDGRRCGVQHGGEAVGCVRRVDRELGAAAADRCEGAEEMRVAVLACGEGGGGQVCVCVCVQVCVWCV